MRFLSEKTFGTAQFCDYVWARRARRSFRMLIAACLLLTGILWFAEGYLRYEQSETQYRMSLTLHPAQARPILRTVVRRETELRETPSSLYVEALAQVEEPDKVLETYARAYQINPRNTSLVINYGCYLYFDGQYEEARERFREAGVNPPRNALPRYLEAAALAAMLDPDDDLSDLIALLARANVSGDPVLFPDPLWHTSLPKRGKQYTQSRRDIAARISYLLLQCSNTIANRAHSSIEQGELLDWNSWLEKVQTMGVRLMGKKSGDSPPTIIQLATALEIQRQALMLRGDWSKLSGGVVDPEINNALLRINETLDAVKVFEEERDAAITAHHARLTLPMSLIATTFFLFALLYACGLLLHRVGSSGKWARAIPHVWIGKSLPVFGFSVLSALLVYLMIAHHKNPVDSSDAWISVSWYSMVSMMVLLGILYPILQLRHAGAIKAIRPFLNRTDTNSETEAKRTLTVLRYIGVYGCLFRRYMGVLIGELVVLVCIWLVVYRITFDAYPFQLELLTTGLEKETETLIGEIYFHLANLIP